MEKKENPNIFLTLRLFYCPLGAIFIDFIASAKTKVVTQIVAIECLRLIFIIRKLLFLFSKR